MLEMISYLVSEHDNMTRNNHNQLFMPCNPVHTELNTV